MLSYLLYNPSIKLKQSRKIDFVKYTKYFVFHFLFLENNGFTGNLGVIFFELNSTNYKGLIREKINFALYLWLELLGDVTRNYLIVYGYVIYSALCQSRLIYKGINDDIFVTVYYLLFELPRTIKVYIRNYSRKYIYIYNKCFESTLSEYVRDTVKK